MIKTETMSDVMLRALRNLIANDSYAMSFQSMGQYRSALLNHVNNLAYEAIQTLADSQAPGIRPQATAITRSPCVCVRCGQPQGASHLPACPLPRFTTAVERKEDQQGQFPTCSQVSPNMARPSIATAATDTGDRNG